MTLSDAAFPVASFVITATEGDVMLRIVVPEGTSRSASSTFRPMSFAVKAPVELVRFGDPLETDAALRVRPAVVNSGWVSTEAPETRSVGPKLKPSFTDGDKYSSATTTTMNRPSTSVR